MANNNDSGGRGSSGMDADKRDIASNNGQSQAKDNTNSGNFANDRQKASDAGSKGGQARSSSNSKTNDVDDD